MKRVSQALALVVLGYAALLLSELLPPSSEARRLARAQMEAPLQQAHGERNAFALLWALNHDVPEAALEQALAADLQRFAAHDPSGETSFRSALGQRYAELPRDSGGLCTTERESCLAFLRSDPARSGQSLQLQTPQLQRLRRLADYDHLAQPFPTRFDTPLPELGGIGALLASDSAWRFLQGDQAAALAQLCGDLHTLRRLRSRTDLLVFDVAASAYAGQLLRVLAELRAEAAAETPLAGACAAALAPLQADELDQCDVWRGEYRLLRHAIEHELPTQARDKGWLQAWSSTLLVNQRASLERLALPLAQQCGASPRPLQAPVSGPLDALFDPLGSRLTAVAQPSYAGFRGRLDELADLLRATRLLDALARANDPTLALGRLPEVERRGLHYDELRRSLRLIRTVDGGEIEYWQLPLPGSAQPAPR